MLKSLARNSLGLPDMIAGDSTSIYCLRIPESDTKVIDLKFFAGASSPYQLTQQFGLSRLEYWFPHNLRKWSFANETAKEVTAADFDDIFDTNELSNAKQDFFATKCHNWHFGKELIVHSESVVATMIQSTALYLKSSRERGRRQTCLSY
jgi:hypothetical protein